MVSLLETVFIKASGKKLQRTSLARSTTYNFLEFSDMRILSSKIKYLSFDYIIHCVLKRIWTKFILYFINNIKVPTKPSIYRDDTVKTKPVTEPVAVTHTDNRRHLPRLLLQTLVYRTCTAARKDFCLPCFAYYFTRIGVSRRIKLLNFTFPLFYLK